MSESDIADSDDSSRYHSRLEAFFWAVWNWIVVVFYCAFSFAFSSASTSSLWSNVDWSYCFTREFNFRRCTLSYKACPNANLNRLTSEIDSCSNTHPLGGFGERACCNLASDIFSNWRVVSCALQYLNSLLSTGGGLSSLPLCVPKSCQSVKRYVIWWSYRTLLQTSATLTTLSKYSLDP